MKFDNIIIFRTGHLGDILTSLPAFWRIRDNFPNSRIALLTNRRGSEKLITAEDFLPRTGLFDEFIGYPSNAKGFQKIKGFLKTIRTVRRGKYDCLIYLMNRNRSLQQIERDRLFFRLCGIKKIVGINHLNNNLLDYNVEKPLPGVKSETEFFLECLNDGELNLLPETILKTDLRLTAAEHEAAERRLREIFPSFKEFDLIAIAPGSKWESKIWGDDKYAGVLRLLMKKFKILPIIFGGREDRESGNRILSEIKTGFNAAGILSIRESAALLSKCRLYLGNDTGTMHLAAAVGVECAAVFSAVDFPGRWHPAGNRHNIFRHQVECEGCHSSECFNHKLCLEIIDINSVYNSCVSMLNAKRDVSS